MAKKGPGRAYREGMTIVQLMDMFPTEEAATEPGLSLCGLAGRRAALWQVRIDPHDA